MLFLTTIPSLLNIWGIDGPIKAIFFPTESTRILQIIPDYWQFLWPLTYYYIGCYLKEYGAKLSSGKSLLLFMGFLTIFGFLILDVIIIMSFSELHIMNGMDLSR